MADTYDMNTLLPAETIQAITQLYGSPAFADTNGYNNRNGRVWGIHFFTGRIPTAAEFYYGTYVDKIGDSHKTLPMALSHKYLGRMEVACDAQYDASNALVSINMKANGAAAPDGITFVRRENHHSPVSRDPNSDLSWMLDWSFSASNSISLGGGNRAALRQMDAAGDLVFGAKPTWFYISDSQYLLHTTMTGIDHPTLDNQYQAYIERTSWSYPDRQPIIMGTVGALGSGADFELAVGGDAIVDVIKPVSLRIQCNPTTTPTA